MILHALIFIKIHIPGFRNIIMFFSLILVASEILRHAISGRCKSSNTDNTGYRVVCSASTMITY